jgi:hypothetical protein
MAGPPAACGVSRHPDREIQAVNHDIYPSVTFRVDRLVGEASASNYHALILPSGAVNPDNLRQDGAPVGFVRDFVAGVVTDQNITYSRWPDDRRRSAPGRGAVCCAMKRPAFLRILASRY